MSRFKFVLFVLREFVLWLVTLLLAVYVMLVVL